MMGKGPVTEGSLARKQVIIIEADKAFRSQKLRVAAYARVSSDSDDQMNSFLAQTRYYTTYITSHEEWTFVDLYADEGITGTSAEKRTEFQRLIADCKRGLIDRILCKSISRFARNTIDCLETVRELKNLGIGVYFEEQNIDTAQMSGELLTTVFAAISQKESESISQNMKWSYQRRMESGEFITCKAPFGYRLKQGKLEIDESEAQIVRQIFSRYLEGQNVDEIAAWVGTQGIQTRDHGENWYTSAILYILRNERYVGNALLQKKWTTEALPRAKKRNYGEKPQYYLEDSHPPIVSAEVFTAVQELLTSRSPQKVNHGPRERNVFAKKIICGQCGSVFRRAENNGRTYWSCRNHFRNKENCPITQIPECEIQAAFLCAYHRLRMDGIPVLKQLAANLRKIREQRFLWRVDIVELNKQIGNLMDQNRMLAEMQKHGLLDSDLFLSQSNGIAQRLREAQAQKERLMGESEDLTLEQTKELLESLSSMPEYLPDFDEGIFTELVERITVESNTSLCFCLKNGLKLQEVIERTVRR